MGLFTEHLIVESRKLLHQVYQIEQNWIPSDNLTANFCIESGQLKDRFDNTAIWFCVVDEISLDAQVVSVFRCLSGNYNFKGITNLENDLSVLDITSYPSSPEPMNEWIQNHGVRNVFEAQRNATKYEFRGFRFGIYLMYFMAKVFTDEKQPLIYREKTVCIASSVNATNQKYSQLAGGRIKPKWSLKYSPISDTNFSQVTLVILSESLKSFDKLFSKVKSKL